VLAGESDGACLAFEFLGQGSAACDAVVLINGEYGELPPVSYKLPPMLIVVSSEDVVVNTHTAQLVAEGLRARGTDVQFCTVDDAHLWHRRGSATQVADAIRQLVGAAA